MDSELRHATMAELEAGLEHIRRSPSARGTLEMIVRRPSSGQREIVEAGELDVVKGLLGDNWSNRRSSRTKDGRRLRLERSERAGRNATVDRIVGD
jgi:hypothetical protein